MSRCLGIQNLIIKNHRSAYLKLPQTHKWLLNLFSHYILLKKQHKYKTVPSAYCLTLTLFQPIFLKIHPLSYYTYYTSLFSYPPDTSSTFETIINASLSIILIFFFNKGTSYLETTETNTSVSLLV